MYLWILIVGSFASFYNAWGIGANDCANSFATSVGAKVLSLKKAIIVASVFEFLGAFLMGSHVTSAIRKKIVSIDIFEDEPGALMFGMLCSNIAAGIWLNLATYFKFPVSTTHSIIGAIIGFSLAYGGGDSVLWDKVGMVVASWVLSPVLAGVFSLLFYSIIKKYVFNSDKPVENTILIFPILTFFTFLINGFFIFYKGTPQLKLDKLDLWVSIVVAFSLAIVMSVLSWYYYLPYAKRKMDEKKLLRLQAEEGNSENNSDQRVLVLDDADQLNQTSDDGRTQDYRLASHSRDVSVETNMDTFTTVENVENTENLENVENKKSSWSILKCFNIDEDNLFKDPNIKKDDNIYVEDLSIFDNVKRLKDYIQSLIIEKADKGYYTKMRIRLIPMLRNFVLLYKLQLAFHHLC